MAHLLFASLLALACLALLARIYGLRSLADEFPAGSRRHIGLAMLWAILTVCVFFPAVSGGDNTDFDAGQLWFPTLFLAHGLLASFLFAWWRLRYPQSLARFLLLDRSSLSDLQRGLWLGCGGWVLTIASTALVAMLIGEQGMIQEPAEIPSFMRWLADLSVARKLAIVGVAMTVEEAFFRGFLQPRIGLLASSILFALGHASYGLPLLMFSVLIISLIIGWSLRQTGRLLPCIVAHGVFDGIQLLLVIPWAVRAMGHG